MANEVDNLKIRINANVGKAAKNIEKLAAALDKLKGSAAVSSLNQLSGSLNKVANSSNTLNKNINSLTKIGNSYNKTVGTMHIKTSSWSNSVFRSAMNIRASFLLIRGAVMTVANTLGDCFKESSEYIENLNLFAVSMGENYDKAKQYAEQVQGALGIDASAWMAYQGKFQNLATGFGIASDKAAVMSQTLTQLTYDLSSFFNVDFDTAFKKLQSGMTGQIKGLKEYGINLSVAALQEYADAHAINVKVRQLTEAERAILRYNLVMERTAKMQGDMARTIITPANSMRIFANQVTLAKRAIGNLISVVLVKFIPYMQAFVRVIEWVASELAKLFGFELPKIDYSDLGTLADATGGVNEAIEDVGDSAAGSTKKVKELKKNLLQLMGFDEINILKAPAEDVSTAGTGSGGSAAVGGGSLGGFADNIPTYDFLKNLDTTKADELFEKFKKIGQKVIDIVKWTIKWWDVIKFIGKLLIGIWAVGKIVKFVKYLQMIVGFVKSLHLIKRVISVWDTFWAGFSVGKKILNKGFFSSIGTGFKNIRANMSGTAKAAVGLVSAIAGFFSFKDLFYNLQKGTLTWKKGLLDVGIAAVAIGAAFALSGPVGGIIAILGTIAGAFFGVSKALDEQNQKMQEAIQKAASFTYEYQIADQRIQDATASIEKAKTYTDDLATATTNYKDEIANLNLANTLIKDIETLNAKTKLTTAEQNLLRTKVNLLNSLNLEGIRAEFDETTGHVKQSNAQLEEMRKNMIKNAQAAALQEVLTEYYKNLYKSISEAVSIQKEKEAADKAVLDSYRKVYELELDYNKALGDALGDKEKTAEVEKTYGDNLRIAKEQLSKSQEAVKNLNKAYESQTDVIAKAADGISSYQKILEGLDTKKAGEDMTTGLANGALGNEQVWTDAVKKITGDGERVLRDTVGWHSPWELTTKAGIAFDDGLVKGINARKSKVTSTISKVGTQAINAFNKSITGLKTGGFSKAFDDIAKKANNTFKTSTWSGYASSANSALNTFSTSSVVKKLSNVYDKAKAVFKKDTWNNFKTSVNKVNTVVFDSLHLKMNNIRTKAKSVFSADTWESYAKQVSKGFDRGLNLPKFELQIGQDTNVKLSKAQKAILKAAGINKDYMPLISWKEYAGGGKPINGEYFIARENGAELVGRVGNSNAVMNNDQIVAAVSQGVYNAVVGAMSGMQSGDGGTYNINVYAQIDERTVGEASIQYHNGQVRQKGASPLIGVAKA